MNVTFITGISQGLGYALAVELKKEKQFVVGIGKTDRKELHSSEYRFFHHDLRNPDRIAKDLLQELSKLHSEIKISHITLINNAALGGPLGIISTLDPLETRDTLNVVLNSAIEISKAFIQFSNSSKITLKIIHISSGSARQPLAGIGTYCIAKAGLEMLSHIIHSETPYYSSPVQSVIFSPGTMETKMQSEARNASESILPTVDLFKHFHQENLNRKPELVAEVMCKKLIMGSVESGKTYSIVDLLGE